MHIITIVEFHCVPQRKFTTGDLIMIDADLGIDIGTRITLDKVTLVGSR